jgi:hypothetical protein
LHANLKKELYKHRVKKRRIEKTILKLKIKGKTEKDKMGENNLIEGDKETI